MTPVSAPSHTRRDKGVIISYELSMQNNIFIVEKFHNQFYCSVCAKHWCNHAILAREIEDQFQTEQKPDPVLGRCIYCGWLAKRVNGIAICLSCAS